MSFIQNDCIKNDNVNVNNQKTKLKEKIDPFVVHYEYINEEPRTETIEYANGIVCTVEYQSYSKIETWFKNGLKHRDNDKPSMTTYHCNGRKSIESWYVNGLKHRNNGLPAVIGYCASGKVNLLEWWVDNRLHRNNDDPARVVRSAYFSVYKEWYVNGLLHRDNDLPACDGYSDEEECVIIRWYVSGKLHRNNGKPASIIYDNYGIKLSESWYVNDCKVDKDYFQTYQEIIPTWIYDNV